MASSKRAQLWRERRCRTSCLEDVEEAFGHGRTHSHPQLAASHDGVASPGMASWNQLLGWLREMNELRLALAEKAA